MLQIGNEVSWSITNMNDNPSNPQQPIQRSLRDSRTREKLSPGKKVVSEFTGTTSATNLDGTEFPMGSTKNGRGNRQWPFLKPKTNLQRPKESSGLVWKHLIPQVKPLTSRKTLINHPVYVWDRSPKHLSSTPNESSQPQSSRTIVEMPMWLTWHARNGICNPHTPWPRAKQPKLWLAINCSNTSDTS